MKLKEKKTKNKAIIIILVIALIIIVGYIGLKFVIGFTLFNGASDAVKNVQEQGLGKVFDIFNKATDIIEDAQEKQEENQGQDIFNQIENTYNKNYEEYKNKV